MREGKDMEEIREIPTGDKKREENRRDDKEERRKEWKEEIGHGGNETCKGGEE
jgi:hypothetical protein